MEIFMPCLPFDVTHGGFSAILKSNRENGADVMKPRILFVDDEAPVLDGLRRMLRPMRHQWSFRFALSGEEALDILSAEGADVLVTDMRMPGMSGGELLGRVMQEYPQVIRIVLSGHSDMEYVLQSVLPAHQYLSKPCSHEELQRVIQKCLDLNKLVGSENIRKIVTGIHKLPAMPRLYREIMAEIDSLEPSVQKVGRIIASDAAMSVKTLQLVNSSFFGFAGSISCPERAVALLGLNIVRPLILSLHIFSRCDSNMLPHLYLDRLWRHSLVTAKLSQGIAWIQGVSRREAEAFYIAGFLHDFGKIIFITEFKELYSKVLDRVRQGQGRVCQVEMELMGITHAEVGAYLTGLWGLPLSVAEAIAFHHVPHRAEQTFRPLVAVHVANVLDHRYRRIHSAYAVPELDRDFLDRLGLGLQLRKWEEMAIDMLSKDHPNEVT